MTMDTKIINQTISDGDGSNSKFRKIKKARKKKVKKNNNEDPENKEKND